MKKIVIAIDGFSSTGKSTLARVLAQKLNYTYVDSGAMYRAITLYFYQQNIQLDDVKEVLNALEHIEVHFEENIICLNGEKVESQIRAMEISNRVSEVSAIEAVRHFAVEQQQRMGEKKGIVMDGRDIGTTVFPQAELKIYLTADPAIRANRRFQELLQKDSTIDFKTVADNLKHRDHIDSTREVSPLRIATDAVILDNSTLSFDQTVETAYQWALAKIND
jgi:cytidylate kinase